MTCPSARSSTSAPAPPQATKVVTPMAAISSVKLAASGAPTPGCTTHTVPCSLEYS